MGLWTQFLHQGQMIQGGKHHVRNSTTSASLCYLGWRGLRRRREGKDPAPPFSYTEPLVSRTSRASSPKLLPVDQPLLLPPSTCTIHYMNLKKKKFILLCFAFTPAEFVLSGTTCSSSSLQPVWCLGLLCTKIPTLQRLEQHCSIVAFLLLVINNIMKEPCLDHKELKVISQVMHTYTPRHVYARCTWE